MVAVGIGALGGIFGLIGFWLLIGWYVVIGVIYVWACVPEFDRTPTKLGLVHFIVGGLIVGSIAMQFVRTDVGQWAFGRSSCQHEFEDNLVTQNLSPALFRLCPGKDVKVYSPNGAPTVEVLNTDGRAEPSVYRAGPCQTAAKSTLVQHDVILCSLGSASLTGMSGPSGAWALIGGSSDRTKEIWAEGIELRVLRY